MSDNRRSVLSTMPRPSLAQPVVHTNPEAEEALLGGGEAVRAPAVPGVIEPLPAPVQIQKPVKVATAPVTFHLPVTLHKQLKIASQVRGTTMLDIVRQQLERYLQQNPLTEAELRQLMDL